MNILAKDMFAALAHDTRIRCTLLLVHFEELCVCELTHAIGAAQPHISRHLAYLHELGLIIDWREGLYSLPVASRVTKLGPIHAS